MAAAEWIASSFGLTVEASTVLHDSNKLTIRLLPCDIVARVGPADTQAAQREIDIAQRLVAAGSPVAALDPRVEPRVHEQDGFAITLWTYYEPVSLPEIAPGAYVNALERLHADMRTVDIPTPHFNDRVAEAQQVVADRERSPALADEDRNLLGETLRTFGRTIAHLDRDQLLHGEPHAGNLLNTASGLRFVDFETCCRGPLEFDLAHAPREVGELYPALDRDLLDDCRILVLAMIAAWRWDRDDELPGGRRMANELLGQLRRALAHEGQ